MGGRNTYVFVTFWHLRRGDSQPRHLPRWMWPRAWEMSADLDSMYTIGIECTRDIQQFIHVPAENKSERAAEGRAVHMIVSQICNPYFESSPLSSKGLSTASFLFLDLEVTSSRTAAGNFPTLHLQKHSIVIWLMRTHSSLTEVP